MIRSIVLAMALVAACGGKKDESADKQPAQPAQTDELTKARDEAVQAAEHARAAAEAAAHAAMKEAEDAKQKVMSLQKDADDLSAKVDAQVKIIAEATDAATRDKAKAALDELRKQKAELDQRVADAKASAAKAERTKGVKVDPKCLDNPLAEGCQ